ncbi:hypothetical protein ACCO45_011235 [Purpureocillium lilacinum]|uniref:Uncharacterized protein n=1 Tax=Purpureocillium lilacinum TaxID=33203 RepID=A0ACC4DH25_PURLI
MGFCERCAGLTLDEFFDRPIFFHPDLATLKSKADAGCPFCSLCWVSILRTANKDRIEKLLRGESAWDEGQRWTPKMWLMGGHFHTRGRHGAFIQICCGKPTQVVGGEQEEDSNPADSVSARLEAYELPGQQSTYRLLGRRSTAVWDPELRTRLIQGWLYACRKNHPKCKAANDTAAMPTRVIDVGSPDGPSALRLVPTQGIREPYIALSYCWGVTADDILTLTPKTYASMMQGITESDLAQAHRDTISLARALGIRYIWIDALCIIQGDEADWTKESKSMAQVYGNAALTVVAGRSADARNGYVDNFVDSSVERSLPPCRLPVGGPPSDTGSDGGFVMVSLPRSTDLGPVVTRAWCCQERTCCRRAIMFGTEQLIFECETERVYENGLIKENPAPRFAFEQQQQQPSSLPPAQPAELQDAREVTLRKWYNFIYGYTACHLSNPHDIFAAIAAIAQQAARGLDSRYLAGIWECDMLRGLLWKPCYHHEVSTNGKILTTRPKPTRLTGPATKGPIVRAPSWSWAAVEGPVSQESNTPPNIARFRDPSYARVRPVRANPAWWTREEDDERCGPDKLRVPALELLLIGHLAAVRVSLPRDDAPRVIDYITQTYPRRRHPLQRLHVEGLLLFGAGETTRLDGDDPWSHVVGIGLFDREKVGVVYCLPLVQNKGLLLEKSEDGARFSRLGWFYVEKEAWFSNHVETEICLC